MVNLTPKMVENIVLNFGSRGGIERLEHFPNCLSKNLAHPVFYFKNNFSEHFNLQK